MWSWLWGFRTAGREGGIHSSQDSIIKFTICSKNIKKNYHVIPQTTEIFTWQDYHTLYCSLVEAKVLGYMEESVF